MKKVGHGRNRLVLHFCLETAERSRGEPYMVRSRPLCFLRRVAVHTEVESSEASLGGASTKRGMRWPVTP